jgi:ribosomal protein L24
MNKLKKSDPVIVISWKNKWKVSTIENIEGDRVYVKWVNEAKKAVKGKWFIKKTLSIHISNIMYYMESEKKWTKIKIEKTSAWKKVRKSKKFNSLLD